MEKPTSKSKTLKISQSQEVAILRRIVEITNSELDLHWILNEVVKIVTEMTKADSVFIYLYDEKKKHLVLMASKTPMTRCSTRRGIQRMESVRNPDSRSTSEKKRLSE